MTLEELKKSIFIEADLLGSEQEYTDMIINSINTVGNKIVAFAKNKIKYIDIETEDKKIVLPLDLIELLQVLDNTGKVIRYRKIDNNNIEVLQDGIYKIKYSATFPNISRETQDSYVIEIDDVCLPCLIKGVASELAVDDLDRYDMLANEYNNLLLNLSQLDEAVHDYKNGKIEIVESWC